MDALPEEVLVAFFCFLEPPDLRNVALCCRRLAAVASDEHVVSSVCRNGARRRSGDPLLYDRYVEGEPRDHKRDYSEGTFEEAFVGSYWTARRRIDSCASDDLEIGRLELKVVPREIGQLSGLVCLSMQSNKLKEVPREIGRLSRLRYLTLRNNRLETLPVELFGLTELEVLDVGINRLGSLPSDVRNLQKLEQLVLDHNLLNHVPDEIGCLKRLKHLNLWSNRVEELPERLGCLGSLESLNVDDKIINGFSKETLRRLGRLRHLGNGSGNNLIDLISRPKEGFETMTSSV